MSRLKRNIVLEVLSEFTCVYLGELELEETASQREGEIS